MFVAIGLPLRLWITLKEEFKKSLAIVMIATLFC
jgi:hypothetical protein